MNFEKGDLPSIPWVESPFFYELLKDSALSEQDKEKCSFFHSNGYVILDLGISDNVINSINTEVEQTLLHGNFASQQKYEYTNHARLFELWKTCKNIKKITSHPVLVESLRILYGREPFPFSTINFTNPTSQPLHSDTIHFNSYPKKWMVGVWIALEDCDKNNGTLRVVPGSHHWKEFTYQDIGIPHPDTRENGEKLSYREYDRFIDKLVKAKTATVKSVPVKKGQAILWASNLLHGGTPVEDPRVSRKSIAIHYFFEGCKEYYTPMFSEPMAGIYASKWCDENNNILTYSKGEK